MISESEVEANYRAIVDEDTNALMGQCIELAAMLKGKWIACKDKMPEEKTWALCAMKDGIEVLMFIPSHMGVRNVIEAHWRGRGASSVFFTTRPENVTHWQPLPAMPNAS